MNFPIIWNFVQIEMEEVPNKCWRTAGISYLILRWEQRDILM